MPPPSVDSDATVLAGAGEMGERMWAMDWARTSLGPVNSWPRALETCVRIPLTPRQRHGDQLSILVVTAEGGAREKARRVGAYAYLHKPFDVDESVERVKGGIAQR